MVVGLVVAIILLPVSASASGRLYGVLLNDDDPWIVRGNDGAVYECEWYGGDITFWEDDTVLLTTSSGFGYMIGIEGASEGSKARVWVEEK